MASVAPPDRLLRTRVQNAVLHQEAPQLLAIFCELRHPARRNALPLTDGIVDGQAKSPFAKRRHIIVADREKPARRYRCFRLRSIASTRLASALTSVPITSI